MATTIFSLVGKIALDGMKRVNSDIKEAEKQTKDLQKALGMLGQNLSKVGGALSKNLTAPLAGVGVAIGALALKTGEYSSELLSLKEVTGLSTDAIQEYEQVARAAGVSGDAFLKNVSNLSKSLEDISTGSGPAAVAMDRLGISVTNSDGSLRSMDELLPEIIGKLNGIEDVNQRNGIAADIFGKKLKDVSPILAMTSSELDAVRKSAHDTGKVMGEDALKNADQFRLSIDNLKKDFSMLGMQIGNAFIPMLQNQVMPLLQDTIIPLVKGVSDKIKELATWFGNLNPAIQKSAIVFGAAVAAVGPLLLIAGKITLSIKALIPVFAVAGGAATTFSKSLVALNGSMVAAGVGATTLSAAVKGVGGTIASGAVSVGVMGKALTANIAAIPKVIAGFFGMGGAATATTGGVGLLTGGIKALSAVIAANPLGALMVALAAAAFAVTRLRNEFKQLEETKAFNAQTEAMSKRTTELNKQVKSTGELLDEYKKLQGKDNFDPSELERLTNAHVDAVIELKNYSREMNNSAKMTKEETEETRLNVRAKKDLLTETEKADRIITDLERARLKKEKEEREKAYAEHQKELAALVKSHRDATDQIMMTEAELLDKEEQAALEEAKRLGASEAQKQEIRDRYIIAREDRIYKFVEQYEEANKKIAASDYELLNMEESKALKEAELLGATEGKMETIRENFRLRRLELDKDVIDKEYEKLQQGYKMRDDLNAQWEGKLLQQQGSRIAIMEAEKQAAIKAAEETGADTLKIEQYYANEKQKAKEEADAQWQGRLLQQSGNQLAILEAEYARELALAAETGAEISRIEEYYANERMKIQRAVADSWVSNISGVVNKIGSIMSGYSSNEEKRISREYKERRAYIEANVADEEERAAQLAALNEQEEAKKLEIQREQAGRDKALGAFNVVIDTARAIVKTLAEMGPIAGPIMAATIGALGAAQLGVITSEPEPFATGGYVMGGRGGIEARIGEGRQNELVLPVETGTQDLAERLGNILQAQPATTGAPIEYHTHLHVATLIADDKGLKELERRLGTIRISENRRTGRA